MPEPTHEESAPTLLEQVRLDVVLLHETWMEAIFPRQRHDRHPVLGKYRPTSTPGRAGYWAWAAVGAPLAVLLYPFVLLGLVVRWHTGSIDTLAERLGLVGVVLLTAAVWGALSVAAWVGLSSESFLAVLAAAIVATVAAFVGVVAHRLGGRTSTVLVAYPAGMTAIFLPPVVAALVSEAVGDVVFPTSEEVAIWILDTLLFVGGLNELIRESFDLVGLGHVLMWLGIAIPLGWFLGLIVTLADVIRPREA
ncbi:MAG: hypothetical protein ACLFM8_09640, partial [Halobacteriales archaeon]